MRRRATPRAPALALGAVLLACGAPVVAAPQAPRLPQLGTGVAVSHLDGVTGTVIVQQWSGAPAAAVDLWFRAPSVGFGPTAVPSLARVAAQTVAGSKPIVGPSLGDRVSAVGGRLAITTYGDSVSVAALVPADAARDIVHAMTVAYFSPVITDDGFSGAVRDVAMESLISGFDAPTVLRNLVFSTLFSSGPNHYPVLGSAKETSSVTLAQVRTFADRAFREQNAVLVVSGAVEPSVASAASHGRSASPDSAFAAPEDATPSVIAASATPVHQTFDEPAAADAWIGPPIAHEDEATAMDFIADYLFRPGSGIASRAVEEAFPGSFVSGQFITLRDPGVMFVAFGDGDVAAMRTIVDRALAGIEHPMNAATFARARDAFEYHLLSDLQTPSEIADNYGWYSVEGNAEYAPGPSGSSGRYFGAAAGLTPEFVASVAAKYLGKPPATAELAPSHDNPSTTSRPS